MIAHEAEGVETRGEGRVALLERLRTEFRRLDGGYGDAALRRHFATGVGALDRLLPGGGVAAASLVEVVGSGHSPWRLGALIARAIATGGDGDVVVVDPAREVHPPGMRGAGLDLARVVLVRPPLIGRNCPASVVPPLSGEYSPSFPRAPGERPRAPGGNRPRREGQAGWAFAEALAAGGGVACVLGEVEPLGAADMRRLQLAAESGGAVGIIIRRGERPIAGRAGGGAGRRPERRGGEAALRLAVAPRPGGGVAVEVVRCRGGPAGGHAVLEI